MLLEFILHNEASKLRGKSVQNHHSLIILSPHHFPRWPLMNNKFELHHGIDNLEWNFNGIVDTGLSKCAGFSFIKKLIEENTLQILVGPLVSNLF